MSQPTQQPQVQQPQAPPPQVPPQAPQPPQVPQQPQVPQPPPYDGTPESLPSLFDEKDFDEIAAACGKHTR